MTYQEFVEELYHKVGVAMANHEPLRFGQIVFNYLEDVRPDLANKIRATEMDPFHNDKNMAALNEYLLENWE